MLFIWQKFLYNPGEKAKPIGRTGAEQYEHWNADIKNTKRKGTDPGGIWKNISCYQPERFDIVIFKYPDDESRLFIKRVIGLPGEVVEIKDGKVYIDGSPTPLDDSFIPEKMIGSYGPYTVPENCYFMLGDNRNDSKDSRSWKNKFVRFDQIVGKAVVRYYPSFKWLG